MRSRAFGRRGVELAIVLIWVGCSTELWPADDLAIATFSVDATPPIGSPIAYTLAERIDDPLSARGIVIFSSEAPIVLCAVDWIGIANGGLDAWRSALADAAGTTVDRVAVHTLHQHDAPRCDFTAESLLAERGLGGKMFDPDFAREAIARASERIRDAVSSARRPVTHVGFGRARVEKIASTRRLLGPDGKVEHVRFSSCKDPEVRALPEGTIDPWLRLVAFFDGDRPIASLTYYACHPQSYYREGGVSADFVGLARGAREKELPGVLHVHFDGAGGDVAAGKYNDGSHEMRPVLARRLEEAMATAWERIVRRPITPSDVEWRVEKVELPLREGYDEATFLATLNDESASEETRIRAADDLAFVRRVQSGHLFDVACLRLGEIFVVHTPGELFVEYQLAAQAMRPDGLVCFAAYGDYGPGYIGTEISYEQGGYETRLTSSRTAPRVERTLLAAIRSVLRASEVAPERALPRVEPIDWRPVFEGIDRVDLYVDVVRPLRGHALRIRLDAPGISFLTTPSNGEREGETDGKRTSTFLREHALQAAINAAPFSPIHREENLPQDIAGLAISGGVVVSPAGDSARPALVITKEGRARIAKPPFDPDAIEHAAAGFGVVLEKGAIVGVDDPLHPRTAAGVADDGRILYLLVIDGRQRGYSVGVTTREVGAWLRALGAEDGINLDGGGTTTMVLQGGAGGLEIVNRPIHAGVPGTERVSASHFGVRARRTREAARSALTDDRAEGPREEGAPVLGDDE